MKTVLKKIYAIVGLFVTEITTKRILNRAAALTYSTLLAMVPVMAVVFAIARGFGYSKYIELWFRDALSSQPQVADIIIGFVNSYLVHTKSGVILGLGLVFMLWTVLMLVSQVETTFNDIWQVKTPRSVFRTFTDYVALLFLVPIVLVLLSGISIFMATMAHDMDESVVLGPMMRFLIALSPYVIISAIFTAMYVFMPNTKVSLRAAVFPGVLAGVAMQWLQMFYIHSQIWVSSYNAIYGSFAALPLFMLWIQFSWIICLFGAELSFAMQNMEHFAVPVRAADLSHRYRLMLSAMLMSLICKRYGKGEEPYTALQLKLETGLPIRVANDLLYDLCEAHLLNEYSRGDEKGEDPVFVPAEDLANLSVGTLIERLDGRGSWHLRISRDGERSPEWAKPYLRDRDSLLRQRDVLLKDL